MTAPSKPVMPEPLMSAVAQTLLRAGEELVLFSEVRLYCASLESENAAIRELITDYNFGGWTASLRLMQEKKGLKEAIDEQRRTITCLMAGMPEDGTTPVIRRIAALEADRERMREALAALRLAQKQNEYPSWEKGMPRFQEAEALADAALAPLSKEPTNG